ncbi:hypothetical protein PG985_016277 [Apiospora marii]|uniref:Delta(24)-sterol reductase n=1 Tax=Apiospora marii TaxID=335849 RepID=A0ABR1SU04_9PEZI
MGIKRHETALKSIVAAVQAFHQRKQTWKHGLVPPVVMEFPGITAGGGYAGSAGESSSFKYGYFSETVNWAEIVLANGEVVRASRTENKNLFQGAAGAAGTLGIATLLELKLVTAKKYIKLTYHRTSSIEESVDSIKRETANPTHDYVDGIIYSKRLGVVMTGVLTDEKPDKAKEQTFSRPWDPWFYLHVQNKVQEHSWGEAVDYIPLKDYLFRYDRGGFWVGHEAFEYFGGLIPFSNLTRWFLDDFLHTRMLYRALHGANRSFGFMIQNLSLPYATAPQSMEYTADTLDIWPLWLCPLRGIQAPTFHPSTPGTGGGDAKAPPEPMLNIGLWGRASQDLASFAKQNRDLEQRLEELGGRKVLYSHTYYTEPEFWGLYDKAWYDQLRLKYGATGLPSIYDKVKVHVPRLLGTQSWLRRFLSRWPFAGIAGIVVAIRSKDYLHHRESFWKRLWKIVSRQNLN